MLRNRALQIDIYLLTYLLNIPPKYDSYYEYNNDYNEYCTVGYCRRNNA